MGPTRRAVTAIVLLAGALLGAIVLGWFPQSLLRGPVEARLRAAVGPGSRIGSLRVVPGRLSADVHDLVLDAPTYRLEADRVHVELSSRTFFARGLFVDRLEIDGGRLALRTPAEPVPPASPPSGPLVIRGIAIRGLTFSYDDAGLGGEVVLRAVDVAGSVGEGVLALSAGGGTWRRTPPATLGPLHARVRVSPRLELQLESFDAGLERTRLRAAGALGRVGDLRPDLRFEAEAHLDEVARLAGGGPAAGVVSGEGRLWGPVDALRLEAELAGGRLRVAGWPLERLRARLAHEGGAANTTAQVQVGLFGGQGRLEARLRGTDVRGTMTASGLSLEALAAHLGRASPVEGTGSVTVRLTGDTGRSLAIEAEAEAVGRDRRGTRVRLVAQARGPVALPRPKLDLAWTAKAVAEPAAGGAAPAAQVTARGTARGTLPPAVIAELDGTLALVGVAGPEPVALTGRVRAEGERASAELRLAGLGGSAEGTAEIVGARVPALELAGRGFELDRVVSGARGEASFELRASGPVEALSGRAEARIGSLVWRDVVFGPLRAGLTATRGAVEARAELPGLGATADARLPKGGTGVSGTLVLAGTPLRTFAPLLPKGRPLEGTLSGRATFGAPLADPAAGSVEARIEALEASSGALAVHAAQPFGVRLTERRWSVEALDLRGEGFAARVDGTAGLAPGATLDLRASLDAALGDLPLPEGWTAGGAARAEATLAGTRSSPRLDGFVALDDVVLESAEVPPVRVDTGRIELQGDAVVVPGLVAQVADGEVRIEGRVPVAAVWPEARRIADRPAPEEQARLTVSWSGVQAAALARRFAPAAGPAAIDASLAGQADLRGGLASLREPSGTLRIPATTVRLQDLAVEIAPTEVRVEGGRIRAPSLELRAAGGVLGLAGTVDLATRALDLTGRGTLELRALSPFLAEAALTGTSAVDLRVGGTLEAPQPAGSVRVSDGTVRLRLLPQALTGLSAEVLLDGRALRLTRASAELGGGELQAAGQATLDGTALTDARFTLTGRDLAVRYPEGMRSRLEADLTLTGRTGAFTLAGTVRALRGLYDLDAALDQSLAAPAPETAADSPLLRSVALDIRVLTENPVLVRNNLAQLQATGQLTVRGDLQTPAPVGTLEIASGGKVFVQGHEFVIGRGRLLYAGNWDPELALDATARMPDMDSATGGKRADVDVTATLEGRLDAPRLSLTSSPAYSKLEIVNLITTGDSRNTSARLALGGPAATLLAGRLTRAAGGFGLDQVSIQPELVAREGTVETGARFTFGKRLSDRVNLVYSLSLQDPEGRFIQLEGTPGRDVTLSVRRTDLGHFAYGAGQRFRFGGTRADAETSEQRVRIVEVRLEGDQPLEPAELRAAIDARAGDRQSVWDLQEDADRLRGRLVERGYLEAEVAARFDGQVAVFTVRSGSRYGWTVEGMSDPPDLTGTIRSSLFEEEALERGRARLLAELRERGHLRAAVEARARPGVTRTLAFEVRPGPVVRGEVSFPGASALSSSRLLSAAGGAGRLLTEPEAAVRDMVAAYHGALHLAAQVDAPRVQESPGGDRVQVVVPVREGPRARLLAVRFEGATLPAAALGVAAGLQTGAAYDPDEAVAAVDRLRDHYYALGHPAVRINPRVDVRGSDVELVLEVVEGPRVTVGSVVVRGLRHVRQGLVRRHISLAPGDPLDPRRVAELERRLLDLGVFARAAAIVSEDNPATITVTVEEGDRLRAGYLVNYQDEGKSRVELDGELRNLFGAGVTTGGRLSVGPDVRDARLAFALPSLLLPTGRLTTSLFRLEEDLPLVAGEEGGATFERVQTGGQVEGTRPFGDRWSLLYGYRLKQVTVDSEFLTSSHRVAGLDLSVLRDTRDSPLDARHGRFLSLSLEFSPRALGSDFDFVKGYAQAFVTRPLTETLTWAQGYRLGLAHAFRGEPLVADEGFEAGGANSIRGFGTNEVGPADYPFGKAAVIVLNQELRYRHPSGLGGVLFYDGGNTFPTVRDFSLRLRHALGAGLRWSSPVGLLRVDVGVPLFPREGESRYKAFFSFGQAF